MITARLKKIDVTCVMGTTWQQRAKSKVSFHRQHQSSANQTRDNSIQNGSIYI